MTPPKSREALRRVGGNTALGLFRCRKCPSTWEPAGSRAVAPVLLCAAPEPRRRALRRVNCEWSGGRDTTSAPYKCQPTWLLMVLTPGHTRRDHGVPPACQHHRTTRCIPANGHFRSDLQSMRTAHGTRDTAICTSMAFDVRLSTWAQSRPFGRVADIVHDTSADTSGAAHFRARAVGPQGSQCKIESEKGAM